MIYGSLIFSSVLSNVKSSGMAPHDVLRLLFFVLFPHVRDMMLSN